MNKLRVWHMPQVGCDAVFHIPVKSVDEANNIMNILAAYDLFQLENKIKPDFTNVSGLEVFNEEIIEWEDWCSEDGDDIDEYYRCGDGIEDQKFIDELFSQLRHDC